MFLRTLALKNTNRGFMGRGSKTKIQDRLVYAVLLFGTSPILWYTNMDWIYLNGFCVLLPCFTESLLVEHLTWCFYILPNQDHHFVHLHGVLLTENTVWIVFPGNWEQRCSTVVLLTAHLHDSLYIVWQCPTYNPAHSLCCDFMCVLPVTW